MLRPHRKLINYKHGKERILVELFCILTKCKLVVLHLTFKTAFIEKELHSLAHLNAVVCDADRKDDLCRMLLYMI